LSSVGEGKGGAMDQGKKACVIIQYFPYSRVAPRKTRMG
jgi:hypothetical protein